MYLETYKKYIHAINFYYSKDFSLLTNEELLNSAFSKIYTKLAKDSRLFYKYLT